MGLQPSNEVSIKPNTGLQLKRKGLNLGIPCFEKRRFLTGIISDLLRRVAIFKRPRFKGVSLYRNLEMLVQT